MHSQSLGDRWAPTLWESFIERFYGANVEPWYSRAYENKIILTAAASQFSQGTNLMKLMVHETLHVTFADHKNVAKLLDLGSFDQDKDASTAIDSWLDTCFGAQR